MADQMAHKKMNEKIEIEKLRRQNRRLREKIRFFISERELSSEISSLYDVSQNRLLSLLNNLSIIVYQLDTSGRIAFISDAVRRYGYQPEELLGVPVFDLIHPDDRARAQYRLNERRTGDRSVRELRLRLVPGKRLPGGSIKKECPVLLFSAEGIYHKKKDGNRIFIGSRGIAYDISELVDINRKYRDTSEHLQAVLDSVPGSVSWITSDLVYLGVNSILAEKFGKSTEYFVGKPVGFLSQMNEFSVMVKNFFQSADKRFEMETWLEHGKVRRHYLIIGQKYQSDRAAVLVGIDTTNLKKAEEQARDALEKQFEILREIHHRVKNNIQIIMCVMDMQIKRLSQSRHIGEFKDFLARIRSLITIHEIACRSPDVDYVEITDYLKVTVNYFYELKLIDPGRIHVSLPSRTVMLNIDMALPVGIIINELMLNAALHAFPPPNTGRLKIDISRLKDDRIKLVVADDGIGFTDPPDVVNAESFGFQIVMSMIQQLNAVFTLKHIKGTQWQIVFLSPMERVKKR